MQLGEDLSLRFPPAAAITKHYTMEEEEGEEEGGRHWKSSSLCFQHLPGEESDARRGSCNLLALWLAAEAPPMSLVSQALACCSLPPPPPPPATAARSPLGSPSSSQLPQKA